MLPELPFASPGDKYHVDNPYEPPATSARENSDDRTFPFDIGGVVGRYLEALGAITVSALIVEYFCTGNFKFDVVPVLLFICGGGLRRHIRGARSVVIFFLAMMVAGAIAMPILAAT